VLEIVKAEEGECPVSYWSWSAWVWRSLCNFVRIRQNHLLNLQF